MDKTIEKSTDIQNSLVEHKKCSKCKRIYPSASVYFYKNKNRKMGNGGKGTPHGMQAV